MRQNKVDVGRFRPDVFISGHFGEADIVGDLEVANRDPGYDPVYNRVEVIGMNPWVPC
jgi:hypothetical protein